MRSVTSNSVPACSTEFSHSSLARRMTVSATASCPASVSAATIMRRATPGDRASGASRIRRSSGTGTLAVCTVTPRVHAPVARPQHGLVCDSGVVSGAEEWFMTTTRNGAQPIAAPDPPVVGPVDDPVDDSVDDAVLAGLAQALRAVRLGRFDARPPRELGRDVVEEFDALVGVLERRNRDLMRIGRVVGR